MHAFKPNSLCLLRCTSQAVSVFVQDASFEMERKRNRPVKYNRELVHQSVKALEKIADVRPQLLLCQASWSGCMRSLLLLALAILIVIGSVSNHAGWEVLALSPVRSYLALAIYVLQAPFQEQEMKVHIKGFRPISQPSFGAKPNACSHPSLTACQRMRKPQVAPLLCASPYYF